MIRQWQWALQGLKPQRTWTADFGVYKAPMDCTLKHSVISNIMVKAPDLLDFDKGQMTMVPREIVEERR